MELIFLILVMLLAGVFAGLLAGLFGIGGGLVVVPALLYVFHILHISPEHAIHLAIGTSLSTVIVTTFRATQAHAKKDSVDFKLVKSYALPTIIGSVLGVVFGVKIGAKTLILMLAFFLIVLAMKFIFPKILKDISLGDDLPGGIMKYTYGLLLGACSVLFGIGGGSLVVTVMTLYKRPIHQAIGTASAFGVVISIVGCIVSIIVGWSVEGLPFGSLGYVNLIGFLGIITSSSFSAPLGAKLAHKLDQALLKRIFGFYLIFTAIKLALGVL